MRQRDASVNRSEQAFSIERRRHDRCALYPPAGPEVGGTVRNDVAGQRGNAVSVRRRADPKWRSTTVSPPPTSSGEPVISSVRMQWFGSQRTAPDAVRCIRIDSAGCVRRCFATRKDIYVSILRAVSAASFADGGMTVWVNVSMRRRMFVDGADPGPILVGTLVTIALLVTSCSHGSSGASGTASSSPLQRASAHALLSQAVNDAVARGSVHVISVFRRGAMTESFQDDEATNQGRQLIRAGSVRAEVIQIGRRAYLTGNGDAMVHYFGFPQHERSRLADRWVSLTPSDPGYKTVVTDVTINSDINDLLPSAPLTSTITKLDGRSVIAITGRPPASQDPPQGAILTLYVSKTTQPLPIQETLTAPGGISGTSTFTSWGQPVNVSPPVHAIPVSTIPKH
jgi:hypothetical protein